MFHCGMMSGKGKYIWKNGIIYEGDFLNNEIIGSGKYTWPNQSLTLSVDDRLEKSATYEGEVYKGMRHGVGKFISLKTPTVYIG
jgi:hypothetical protein